MARTPETVSIKLHDLMLLLNYRWAAVNSSEIGELGLVPHEDFVAQIDAQSRVEVTPVQLADLIHHFKECTFEKVKPAKLNFTTRNYNHFLRKLKKQAPTLFKETAAGEVVMVELEDRFYE